MKKKYICLVISLVFILSMCFAAQSIAMAEEIDEEKVYCVIDEETDFADDTILVVLTNKVSLSTKRYTAADFSEISCVEVTDLTEELWQQVINHQHSIDCNPERETKAETFHRILKLTISNSSKSNVVDGIRKLEKRSDVKSANPNYEVSIASTPNDSLLSYQWGVNQIDLTNAWDIETGNENVFVGVVDSGIDITHPDLVNRINTELSKDFTWENDPFLDTDGHGTHVAGIIGAQGNNGRGITGVCWNVSLVSLKVFSSSGTVSSVINAITYATKRNIPILNISLSTTTDSPDLQAAIHNYSGLIVCAAGNKTTGGINIDEINRFPASYTHDNVLTVGASTSSDEQAYFSNYGKTSVDIFAPGEDIASTYPISDEYTTGYVYDSGTSMAAPFVTGVAALLLSNCNVLTAHDIKAIILDNCDKVNAFDGKCVTGGRLNAFKALQNSHKFECSYTSKTHTNYCECGYSETTTHTYDYEYIWLNYTHHNATCKCGATTKKPHAVSEDSVASGSSHMTCLFCGGAADRGFVKVESTTDIQLVTENGSYILPNGVIVLVEEDIEAYIRGTMVFVSSNSK